MTKYISGKKASEILKVHQNSLRTWDQKGIIETIRTPGGKRLYNVEKYLLEYKNEYLEDDEEEIDTDNDEQIKIAYVRVSTYG
jgi:predicted site-specific integrase-resolvase